MKEIATARELETLLPNLMRSLFGTDKDDPLTELTMPQLRIMRMVLEGDHTVSSLSEEMALSVSAATQMVNRLEHSGLVERAEYPADRRMKRVRLSARGLALMHRRRDRRVERIRQVLTEMSPEEKDSLVDRLREFHVAARLVRSREEQPTPGPVMEELSAFALGRDVS